jgi:ABC-type transporter Mla maintaining outer membrane lipid asymmetry ATPase subunit MlaF
MTRSQGFEHTHPSDLSGGMMPRLRVARALAANPDILIQTGLSAEPIEGQLLPA